MRTYPHNMEGVVHSNRGFPILSAVLIGKESPELPQCGMGGLARPLLLAGGTRERIVAEALGEGSKRMTEPFRGRLLR
jgi:hypothetical protein